MHTHSRKMSSWNRLWWHQLSLPWKGGMAVGCWLWRDMHSLCIALCWLWTQTQACILWMQTQACILWMQTQACILCMQTQACILCMDRTVVVTDLQYYQARPNVISWLNKKMLMLHVSNMNADNLFLSHISKDEIQRNQRAFHKRFLSVIKCHKFPDKMGQYIWLKTSKNVICWCRQS